MSALQIQVKLRAFGPKVDDVAPDLGELQVSSTLALPLEFGATQLLSGALRDALRSLWEGHYGTGMATGVWYVTLTAERDGRQFEDVRMEDLPLTFEVLVFAVVQGLVEKAVVALA